MDRDRVGPRVDGELRRMLLSPGQLEEDVRQELQFHVEGRVAELMDKGWTEADARAEVLAGFGDLERIARECTEIGMERLQRERRTQRIADALADFRYALRTFRRNPLFTAVVLFTLALGIGATTAVFTVVDRVALRALPFQEPERLVVVWEQNVSQNVTSDNPSGSNLFDWRQRSRTFSGLAAWMEVSRTLTGVERPEVLSAAITTGNFMSLLGLTPVQGRLLAPADEPPEGTPTVAVLSHGAWQRLFGGESMLGRSILLDGSPVEVIGILPDGLPAPRPEVDVWVPGELATPDWNRQTRSLNVIGRLAEGVSIEQAQADMDRVAAQLAVEYPESNSGWGVTLVPAHDQVVGETAQILFVLLAAVIAVLLIACANVANLLFGRAATRVREFGVRTAIGASTPRLRRQLLTESLTLGMLGGLGGVALAYLGVGLFLRLEPRIPRVEEVGIDLRVLAFAAAVSIGTALLFGFVPALRAGRADVSQALKAGGGSRARPGRSGRARPLLVVSEIALSLVLLVGAGLFLRSFFTLRAVDPGFERDGVYAAKVSLDRATHPDNTARVAYFDELLRRLRSVPGVAYAAVTSTLPMDPTGTDFDLPRHAEGHPLVSEGGAPQTDYRIVTPGYVEAMGMELLRGRTFNDFDRLETPRVLLVTESLAESLWPGEDPLGKRITIYYIQDAEWEVVGVVGDTHHHGLAVPASHQMFVPLAQAELLFGYMTVVVKAGAGLTLSLDQVREAAVAVDPNEPLFELQSMADFVGQSIARDSLATISLAVFAALALALALAGIYGVTAYQVASRRHEIGVRMALGARRGTVVRQVLGQAMTLALGGVAIGLLGAGALTSVTRSLLFGVAPLDPVVFLGVPALLLAMAALAALPSARRAASIDPVRAMRIE